MTKEREHARPRANGNRRAARQQRPRDSGPNASKLSDRRGESKRRVQNRPHPPCLFAEARG